MANNLNLTEDWLDSYLNRPITRICTLGFGSVGDAHNHCAHFVGHVLSLNADTNVGLTCASMTRAGRRNSAAGACIRVHEVFNHTEDLDAGDDKGCLIYVTKASNFSQSASGWYVMGNIPRKHIGIYLGGVVWHYGNTKDKVKRQDLADFEATFESVYGGNTAVRYTKFPKKAALAPITLPATLGTGVHV